MPHTVNFTREDLADFKKAIRRAELKGQESFRFKDHEYLVNFAKYVVEYLTDAFAQQEKR